MSNSLDAKMNDYGKYAKDENGFKFKDVLMEHFRKLDEEQQKDVLFMLADIMDFYEDKLRPLAMKERPTKEEKADMDKYMREFEIARTIADAFTEVPEVIKQCGIKEYPILKYAHRERMKYEQERERRKA